MSKASYSPLQFARIYAPLKAKDLSRRLIALKMKVSSRTLDRYLVNPEYVAVLTGETVKAESYELQQGDEHSSKIIEAAYKLHEKGIHDAIFETLPDGTDKLKENPDYDKARQISIDALKIARTEADVKRIFLSIGSLHIGDNVNVFINEFKDSLYGVAKKYVPKKKFKDYCIEVDAIEVGSG